MSYKTIFYTLLTLSLHNVVLAAQSLPSASDTNNIELPALVAYNANRAISSKSKTHHHLIELDKQSIRTAGNTNLAEILEMQVGLTSLSSSPQSAFGTGIQLMGLSEGYVQILENGQPLIGRNAGVLGANRIPSFSIQKLEIIKGTMTNLYGDNALAGVINIVTIPSPAAVMPLQAEITANTAGRYNLDIISSWNLSNQHTLTLLTSGGLKEGYQKNEETGQYASDPQQDVSATLHWVYRPTTSQQLRLSIKGYYTHLQGPLNSNQQLLSNISKQWDYNATAEWKAQLSKKIYFQASLYHAAYTNTYTLKTEETLSLVDSQAVKQSLWRPTLAMKWNNFNNGYLYIGSDIDIQHLSSTRYTSDQQVNNYAVFLQQEWHPKNWTITAGMRADFPDGYEANLSPQIGARYQHKKWSFSSSLGIGYKTPDFRQRFLFFPHNTVGYVVIGREILPEVIANKVTIDSQTSQSEIDNTINNDRLKAETSLSLQLGTTYQINDNHSISLWLFRNNISNLIETYILPFKTEQQHTIYSYRNVQNVYTQGIDIQYKMQIKKHRIALDYHFLYTADTEVEQKVQNGEVFARDGQGTEYKVSPSDYQGLFLRPIHTATLSAEGLLANWLNYQFQFRIQAQMGWKDENGSLYLDGENEYADNLYTLNASIYKRIETPKNTYRVQLGVRNILNQLSPTYYPAMLGINAYIKFYFQIN